MNEKKIIQINDEYRINVEPNNFILQKFVIRKNKETWDIIGYFATVYHALKKVLNSVDVNENMTIKEYVERMESMYQSLKEVIEKM